MYRIVVAVLVSSCVALIIGCGDGRAESSSPEEKAALVAQETKKFVEFVLMNEQTVGNHSYLPISRHEYPHDMSWEVLALLKGFEDRHPDWEVTGWAVEKKQSARDASRELFGLWVDHRPKATPGPENSEKK